MSNLVEVKYGDNVAAQAGALLAAADALKGFDRKQVLTQSDGFLVPEEIADKAGLSYDVQDTPETPPEAAAEPDVVADEALEVPAGTFEERVAWVAEGEDESERTKRANTVHLELTESGAFDDAELTEFNEALTVAVHGSAPDDDPEVASNSAPEPLVGKALNAALEKAGLSKSGKVAEKQARLAEYEKNKE